MKTAIEFLFFCVYWTQHAQIRDVGPIEDHREAAWSTITFMSAPLIAIVLIVDSTLFPLIFGAPVLFSLNAWLLIVLLLSSSLTVHYLLFIRDSRYISIYGKFNKAGLRRLTMRAVALSYIVVPNLALLALIAWQKS